ncbi:unnamed protein product [Bursaphelenchus xylophilus]|uniref:(pine wood nematode) hypothetical protein n=1 Tax=Bursaphelenchus xylophilus TaxID=6326 RepID=A0A1I7SQI4_BURXY|nr:unnamed protein product [Bursaphelenchus xylophilus]CAG9109938.1 unnamed protein product [Bursaphelenchus xylophilus]
MNKITVFLILFIIAHVCFSGKISGYDDVPLNNRKVQKLVKNGIKRYEKECKCKVSLEKIVSAKRKNKGKEYKLKFYVVEKLEPMSQRIYLSDVIRIRKKKENHKVKIIKAVYIF